MPVVFTAGEEGAVDLKKLGKMRCPICLKDIKAEVVMKGFTLLRQPHILVIPVLEDIWEHLYEKGKGFTDDEEGVLAVAVEEEEEG
ncbi:putative thymocyte nuclear protein 1 [Cocos nucifera]|uniref:Putative thymocyte nuclear protein 1 n=1 Tax=Cocos nucifera TaxID=13894 RepID=A0A8K0HXJ4_COCNU|nr:putative thymocyte nuclear protein 1 [Cocos nucifera]